MLEEQAMSRVYRLGQTKPVRLVRFVMQNTWEERIVEVQKRKKTLADLIVDRVRLKDGDAGRKQLLVCFASTKFQHFMANDIFSSIFVNSLTKVGSRKSLRQIAHSGCLSM